jgi:hypothetical protein
MAKASSRGTLGKSAAAAWTADRSPLRSARLKIEYGDPWDVKEVYLAAGIASNTCSHSLWDQADPHPLCTCQCLRAGLAGAVG